MYPVHFILESLRNEFLGQGLQGDWQVSLQSRTCECKISGAGRCREEAQKAEDLGVIREERTGE